MLAEADPEFRSLMVQRMVQQLGPQSLVMRYEVLRVRLVALVSAQVAQAGRQRVQLGLILPYAML